MVWCNLYSRIVQVLYILQLSQIFFHETVTIHNIDLLESKPTLLKSASCLCVIKL